ncbi:GNAT family N-acetyltransferase [Belnapia sp. T6]|uniref:GNAT family N-acetyltransferase n=1 Tax=Belnapia mucosa TaxID=2804532 RepID=A0ABS1V936_9PROT|nr:GNAT family N-acetyltransferase [Belnapia mucosa]MBL6458184.1 GNAT family N-acetyltransferase [Belnapia mucosa]
MPLLKALSSGWDGSVEPTEPVPALRLSASVAALGQRVSGETLGPIFGALLRLRAAHWATRDEGGVLASLHVQAVYREALPGQLRAGLLRLHALRLDDEIVAVIHGLADPPGRDDCRDYFHLSGFDPQLERVSPGMLLVRQAVEAVTTRGMAHADFLRGREAYKYFWGVEDCPTFRRRLAIRGGG